MRTALISIVLTTQNRSSLLPRVLRGWTRQTLPPEAIDIVIVDDGSTDDTAKVVAPFLGDQIRLISQRAAGLASARNHGIGYAAAPIVLFVDDDDVPTPSCASEHIAWHERCSAPSDCVLGRTEISGDCYDDPLMNYVTRVAGYLFSYTTIQHGQVLGFEHFWGGRISCKRQFLLENGIFDARFRFGCEDIELAFRLAKRGLRVFYNARALTTMVRAIDFDSFCRRLRRQGASQRVLAQMHAHEDIQKWARVRGRQLTPQEHDRALRKGRELDRLTRLRLARGLPLTDEEMSLLHEAYRESFQASVARGFHQDLGDHRDDRFTAATPASPE